MANNGHPSINTLPAFTMQSNKHRLLDQVPGLGMTMDVRSSNELCFASLVTTESSLFFIRKGTMTVEARGVDYTARQGEFLLLQAGVPLNITHRPCPNGEHEATGLFWDRKMIADTAPSLDDCLQDPALVLGEQEERFQASFTAAYNALKHADMLPPAIVAHRLREVLIWLSLWPVYFRPVENLTLSSRLRDLLGANPGAVWSEREAAKTLGQSPATLRRHLAAENASFREILVDVRMLYALRLLHSTNQPVGIVASNAGYECQSRFAQRFRKRFGFYPSLVRGHKRGSCQSN